MGARHRSFWPDDMHTKVLDNQPTLYDHTAIFSSSIFFRKSSYSARSLAHFFLVAGPHTRETKMRTTGKWKREREEINNECEWNEKKKKKKRIVWEKPTKHSWCPGYWSAIMSATLPVKAAAGSSLFIIFRSFQFLLVCLFFLLFLFPFVSLHTKKTCARCG